MWYDSWPEPEVFSLKHLRLTQPLIQRVSSAPFPGGKRSGCEPTYLPPSSDVRNKEPPLSIIFDFVQMENFTLHNTKIFYTEFCGAGRERVVFSDEAESCIVGSRVSGKTSPTSEVLL